MSDSTPLEAAPSPGTGEKLDRLKTLLREMFQLDRGDLDFGLYRIMNLKAAEVTRFLDEDLLPQVKTALKLTGNEERAALEEELAAARKNAWALGVDPDSDPPPKIAELNRRLAEMQKDADAEADVYNHLANFFARYYTDGDFVSQRRYSSGGRSAYLIPYDGEEVKLHWANADQYYVKTTENYASYAFKVGTGEAARRVRFEIAAADNEKDNVKEPAGRQRRFVLVRGRGAVDGDGDELVVRFEHRPLTEAEQKSWPGNGGSQQSRINEAAAARIPFNTDASPILYLNGYKSSAWTSLMENRIHATSSLLSKDGVFAAAIDDEQQRELSFLLSGIFQNRLLGTISIRTNPSGRPTQSGYSVAHEYILFAGRGPDSVIGRMPPTDKQMGRFSGHDDRGSFEWRNLRREGSNSDRAARPYLHYPIYITDTTIRVPEMTWNATIKEWLVEEELLPNEQVVFPDNESGVQKSWRWGWRTVMNSLGDLAVRKDRSGHDYVYYKRRPHEDGVVSMSSWFDAKYSSVEHGIALLKEMFGKSNFSYPKSVYAVADTIYTPGLNGTTPVFLISLPVPARPATPSSISTDRMEDRASIFSSRSATTSTPSSFHA